jgi:transglutaminase-like putative cysteine protease
MILPSHRKELDTTHLWRVFIPRLCAKVSFVEKAQPHRRYPLIIRSEFDIQFRLPFPTAMVAMLHLHPSVEPRLQSGNELLVESLDDPFNTSPSSSNYTKSVVPSRSYLDAFGNRCTRFMAPAGYLWLTGWNIIEADDEPDTIYPDAQQAEIDDLPAEVLQYLLPSRYCQVDQFGGSYKAGWERAVAIRDWVHDKVLFNYNAARPTKTAMDVLTERVGVCRDFQHLAITLTRCQNIPARYVTGYIGDIRGFSTGAGDFSAWYQVFLDGQWIDMDARHNFRRLGRILMATGRDAADVAISTSFGPANLVHFYVDSFELDAEGKRVPYLVRDAAEASSPLTLADLHPPTQTNNSETGPTQMQPATS